MAGATNPRIINGMQNPRNWLNMALKVAKHRESHIGKNIPQPMPQPMAMKIQSSRLGRHLFLLEECVMAGSCVTR